VYIVFFATDFIGPFQGFLITLGTPIAAWCGIFLADLTLRRADYSDADLFNAHGRYGRANWLAIGALVVGTALGWGLITNPIQNAHWLDWLGYLLQPFGLGGRSGDWAYANLGVLVALVVGYLAVILFGRSTIRRQEAAPDAGPVPAASAAVGGSPVGRPGPVWPRRQCSSQSTCRTSSPTRAATGRPGTTRARRPAFGG
jgi:hypothetical protein